MPTRAADRIVHAPLSGWAAPLEEVPDPVFAGRMLGDGIAIHPTGDTVHAPFDGVVTTLHASRHAVSVLSPDGVEILIHIGLETVALGGEGFEAFVQEGQQVACGDPLIRFDLDLVGQRAGSLVTPVILTGAGSFALAERVTGRAVTQGAAVMTLRASAAAAAPAGVAEGPVSRRSVTVPMRDGIHARPAARIAACAKPFDAEVALAVGERRATVISPIAVLALGIRQGDEISIEARGHDADRATAAIAALIESGMGEPTDAPRDEGRTSASATPADGQIVGVRAAPGLAIGVAVRLRAPEISVDVDGHGVAHEGAALEQALDVVRARLSSAHVPATERAILDAHLAFLGDPGLAADAGEQIAAGCSAGFAWRHAIRQQVALLEASDNARLAERADDLIDLERQVLRQLSGIAAEAQRFPAGSILLAGDLLPSEIVGLDLDTVVGLCLERGGPTSHVAILAASRGLPAIAAIGPAIGDIAEGALLLLDADAGLIAVDPDAGERAAFHARVAARDRRRDAARAAAQTLCRTADGARIEVFANLGSLEDARQAAANGAEGSGLLRTEFLFLDRDAAPDEDEQTRAYQAIAEAVHGRPIIVRLLDIGGDKPASYLPMPAEDNPALGLRGIRVGLDRPELLETQIRAILRVRPAGQCRIMLPMVASLAEVRAVRTVVESACAVLGHDEPVALGVMIETPAAAMTADLLCAEVDFVSIGTNDLTQYTLAMDRGNAAVAGGVDALHPAVLRLIAQSCAGAAAHGRPVGVCGGLASDPAAIAILIGLGVTELSTTPAFVAEAKALVRDLTLDACRTHAARALACTSAQEVRALADAFVGETMP